MFVGLFGCADDVFREFSVPEAERDGVTILYANYEQEYYEGSAGVVFVREGKLFWVSGSHCSCYGLEEQWSPEPITLSEIRHYASNGATPYGIDFESFSEFVDRFAHLDTETLTSDEVAMLVKLMLG